MMELKDQEVKIGGDDLIYVLSSPVNEKGERMNVKVRGGFADLFSHYDPILNEFLVDQAHLEPEMAGEYLINVIASFEEDSTGEREKFKASFILTLSPPETALLPFEEELEPMEPELINQEEEDFIYIEEWDG